MTLRSMRVLKETLEPAFEIERVPWWRCSEVGACETLLCRRKLGHIPEQMTGRVRHMLDDGKSHERDIVERFLIAGAKVLYSCIEGQVEVVSSERPHCIGHPDGLLDLPKGFPRELDRVAEGFQCDLRYYLLEITAPSHFQFQRVRSQGVRETLWQKYVQMQRYLSAQSIQSYTDSGVCVVKNKNTSEVYEEGIVLDKRVIEENDLLLLRVEGMVAEGKVSDFRCSDWRRAYCQFKHLCFEEQAEPTRSEGVIVGEELAEAAELLTAVEQWKRGKKLSDEGSELVEDAREYFRSILKEYGSGRMSIQDVVAQIYSQTRRSTDMELLERRYPKAYRECVSKNESEVLRVT